MTYFKFKKLCLDGFKSYQKPTTFQLDRMPGLYSISSTVNGVGKSTLIDALHWALSGKTVRNVKGKNVKGWESKHCKVEVDFDYNEVNQNLLRTHSPNSLILNEQSIVQEVLDTKIFKNVNCFIQTIIVGQFHTSFLELSPTERLNFFSEVVSLESWESYSSKASEKVSFLGKEISKLEGQQMSSKSILAGLQQQYGVLIKKNDQFEIESKERKTNLLGLINQFVLDRENKEKELAATTSSLKLAKEDIEITNPRILLLRIRINEEEKICSEIILKFTTLTAHIENSKSELDKWKSFNQNCPYCLSSTTRIIFSDLKRLTCSQAEKLNQKSVLSFDDGQLVDKKILKYWHNPIRKDLIDITLADTFINSRKVTITPDHQIYTPDGIICAGDLNKGSQVIIHNPYALTMAQKQIILGTLLGDGCIGFSESKLTARLFYQHSTSQQGYFQWKHQLLSRLGSGYFSKRENKTGFKKLDGTYFNFLVSNTHCLYEIYLLAKNLYKKNIKRPTIQYLDQLDALGLAVWYMDDGSLHRNSEIRLHVNGYLKEDIELISMWFRNKFNINFKLGLNNRTWELWSDTKTGLKFLEIVSPFIIPSMRYKTSINSRFIEVNDNSSINWSSSEVISIKNHPVARVTYNLEIEDTHNYFAENLLVANCNQPISNNIISTEKSKILKEISVNKILIQQYQSNVTNHKIELNKLKDELQIQLDYLDNVIRTKNKLEIQVATLHTQIQSLIANYSNYQKQLEQELINPYTELITKCKYNITEYENSIIEIDTQIRTKQQDLRGYEFWIKGFKDLRLWLTQDALLALEIETNNALENLGLPDWKMIFNISKENSTGGTSKGLFIDIRSPFNDEMVPIEVWSGGQTQRLKLANTIGMIGLNQNYYGFDSNIEFWDEPSSFLSSEGIENLIDLLSERAKALNKAIYYIDHRALNKSKFDGIIKIISENNVSYIIEE
jgi:hypothetical protein